MGLIRTCGVASLLALLCLLPAANARAEDAFLSPVEANRIAVDAYIYGYPLVTFDKVRQQQTTVAAPDAEHASMGQFIRMRTYPAVDDHCCAAPNADKSNWGTDLHSSRTPLWPNSIFYVRLLSRLTWGQGSLRFRTPVAHP